MRSPLQYRQRALRAVIALPTAVMVGFAGLPTAGAQSDPSISSTESAITSTTSSSSTPTPVSRSAVADRQKIVSDYLGKVSLPNGATVDHVDWISSHRIAVWVKSSVMPEQLMQFQVLLARDWYKDPQAKFPTLTVLDGLEADPNNPTWTYSTNIVDQYADKNVNVLLPVGGKASWYSDWQRTFPDLNYQWDSFIIKEMIPLAEQGFRSNKNRAIVGMSMGATGALNIAEENPGYFKFVGSYSGFLDASTWGAGPIYDWFTKLHLSPHTTQDAWGPWGSKGWYDHDPRIRPEKLRGAKVYVSAGMGQSDYGQPGSLVNTTTPPPQFASYGEIVSHLTTKSFEAKARAAGVDITTDYPASGLHMWPYWQYELAKSTPQILDALGVSPEGRTADCTPYGAIGKVTSTGIVGSCLTNEYDVAGGAGRQQEFRAGQAFWKRDDKDAYALYGDIVALYDKLNGPAGWLGFPRSGELGSPDGKGRMVFFENGAIYWRLDLKGHAIPTSIFEQWRTVGFETGKLGYPVEDVKSIDGGISQKFEHGTITVVNGKGTITQN